MSRCRTWTAAWWRTSRWSMFTPCCCVMMFLSCVCPVSYTPSTPYVCVCLQVEGHSATVKPPFISEFIPKSCRNISEIKGLTSEASLHRCFLQVGGRWQRDALDLLREMLLNRCVNIQVLVKLHFVASHLHRYVIVLEINVCHLCVHDRSCRLIRGDLLLLNSSWMG